MAYPEASAYDILWADAVVVEQGALTGVMPEPLARARPRQERGEAGPAEGREEAAQGRPAKPRGRRQDAPRPAKKPRRRPRPAKKKAGQEERGQAGQEGGGPKKKGK